MTDPSRLAQFHLPLSLTALVSVLSGVAESLGLSAVLWTHGAAALNEEPHHGSDPHQKLMWTARAYCAWLDSDNRPHDLSRPTVRPLNYFTNLHGRGD